MQCFFEPTGSRTNRTTPDRPMTPRTATDMLCHYTLRTFSTFCFGKGHSLLDTLSQSAELAANEVLRRIDCTWTPWGIALSCGTAWQPTPLQVSPFHGESLAGFLIGHVSWAPYVEPYKRSILYIGAQTLPCFSSNQDLDSGVGPKLVSAAVVSVLLVLDAQSTSVKSKASAGCVLELLF